jgi:NtrC-family two-component system response regulator AlgB
MPLNVLVIDDEANIRKALSACLSADNHRPTSVGTAAEAMDAIRRRSFDLALVDLMLGKDAGLDLISSILAESPWTKVVVITAYASVDTAVESMRRGAHDYLPKPFTPAQVAVLTRQIEELRQLEQRVAGLQEALGEAVPEADLTSNSPTMQRALQLARQVAPSDATVLVRGDSGTGKGVIAKAIHAWSTRVNQRFSVVSCPALSPQLLESELFGHVRGSFTGAARDNPGRIAASEGGTLFLDEIGDLPMSLQPKLLRFVQDREYERVGDHTPRKADVRVIAATNVNLEDAVKAGTFRQDLLYRLNVIQIMIPPIRERIDDIVPMAEKLLAYFARQNRKPALRFSDDATGALRGYAWPGNVRELRNVVERAAILCPGDLVTPQQLLLDTAGGGSMSSTPPPVMIGDPVPMAKIEEMHICRVLSTAKSIDEAAKILGMDKVTLWRRRKEYGV